jgi:ATP-dependent Clp endopeptidase proteolytic subunit ClpP
MKDYYWGTESVPETETDSKTIHDFAVETKGHASTDFNVVDSSHNRVYFYSGVTRPKILKLNKHIFNLNANMIKTMTPYDIEPPPIYLHINSYGGSVFAGLAAVDYIKNSKVPVYTVIDGCAASAATLMSCVGSHRLMHRNSCMLIHQLSGAMWGKFEEMQDDMENSKMLMEKIKKIYREHTNIPKRQLDNMLKRDLWWEAEKCLQYGLIDEII